MARKVPTREGMEQVDFDHFLEKEVDLSQYFNKQQLEEMSSHQQTRWKNIAQNYEIMLHMGLPAIKPDFMRGRGFRDKQQKVKPRPRNKRFQEIEDDSDSDSDVTWTPDLERDKNTKDNVACSIVLPQKRRISTDGPSKKRAKICKDINKKKPEKKVYELREKRAASFMHLEAPDDDLYLFCEECNKEYDTDCPIHGPLNYIKDTEVQEENDPDRALHTLPPGLVVIESGIAGAGLGVFTEEEIAPRVMFGPYGGIKIYDEVIAHDSGYCWQIYTDGKPSHFVDAMNKAKANWMRYVNCAPSESEQNLVAFQLKGEIYYRSYKTINPGTELLCWYGNAYGRELGLVRDKNLLIRPELVEGEECYPCVFCKICFTTAVYNVRHLLRMHRRDKLTQCDIQVLDEWLRKNDRDKYMKTPPKSRSQSCLYKNSRNLNWTVETNKDHPVNGKNISDYLLNNKLSHDNYNKMQSTPMETQSPCNKYKIECADFDKFKEDKERNTCSKISGCNVIGDALCDSNNLSYHIYLGEKQFKCNVCSYACNESGILKKHVMTHTGEKPFKCNVCSYACNSSGHLKKHMMTHTGEKPFKCNVCSYACNESGILKKHMMTHTGEKPFKCNVCSYACNQSGNLKKHMMTHTGEKPFKCNVCSYACNHSGYLKTHMMTHTGEKSFKCNVCSYACNSSGHLKKHMMTHTGEKPFKCNVCSYACNQSAHLKKHMRIHTGEKPFKCNVCSYACNQSAHLKKHMMIHTGEKPFKCNVCSYAFNQSGSLKIHMMIHTGEKPFKCNVCSYAFNQGGDLKRHMMTHTGEKSFKCNVCSYACNQRGYLKTHMMTHTGEKPFKCNVCSYACNNSSNLKTHMMTHTGEKQFKCNVCSYACNTSGSLKKHMMTHTGEKQFKCMGL